MVSRALVGSWRLASFEVITSAGETSYPFGQDASGLLVYGPEGRMSVQIARPGRPEFADENLGEGTAEEVGAAYAGYIAYFGTYQVAPDEGKVTHYVQGSLFPNWVGHAQERFYQLAGDTLLITTPPTPFRGDTVNAVLTWERASRRCIESPG